MRISIRLDDDLLAEVKIFAARSGKTMTAMIEDALRSMLVRQQMMDEERKHVRLTTVSGFGLQPGVDLDDSATMVSLMDEGDDST